MLDITLFRNPTTNKMAFRYLDLFTDSVSLTRYHCAANFYMHMRLLAAAHAHASPAGAEASTGCRH